MMHISRADTNKPNLGFGSALAEPFTNGKFIVAKFVGPAIDVNSSKFALVGRREMRTYRALIHGVPAPSELFFRVAAFDGGHSDNPRFRLILRPCKRPNVPKMPSQIHIARELNGQAH